MKTFKEYINEDAGTLVEANNFEKKIQKLFQQKEKIVKQQADAYSKAIKKVFKDLEGHGYKKENDYAPADDASDEEWSEWESLNDKYSEKYGVHGILKSDKVEVIGDKIWELLKTGIDNQPRLRQFAGILTDPSKKYRLINGIQKIFLNMDESLDEAKQFNVSNVIYGISADLSSLRNDIADKRLFPAYVGAGVDVKKDYLDAIKKIEDSLESVARKSK